MSLRLGALVALLTSLVHGSPPNLVFIVSDDQAWGDYGFMGNEQLETPRLDRLAKQSLVFTRGTTHVPLCRPSLATLLTGLHPHQHGVTGNDPALPDPGVNPMTGRNDPEHAPVYRLLVSNFSSRPNLARDLSESGYRTFQTGKWWEGDPVADGGFTDAMTRGTGKGARHGDDGLAIGREGLEPVTDFLDGLDGAPFFLWYAPFLPHAPHNAPQRLVDKYTPLAPSGPVARYWACVEWFDETCGALLDELDARSLLDNTLVVYTTDNGWIQDPGRRNRFAPRSKRSPYEGGVRTPIMFCWPGRVEPSIDRESLAGNVDLWPTVASLMKREIPDGLPGIDLTDPGARAKRTRIFGASYAHDVAEVSSPTRSLEARYVIEGWHKLIVPTAGRPAELYDLRSDPGERSDLAEQQAGEVTRLTKALDDWWRP